MSSQSQEQALHELQQEQSRLLDKIDELRSIGVGNLVELPQLIVCGNQSSGKSSVLEAISRVRFPAKSNVCTRFATEVILRRSQNPRVKISIQPGPSRVGQEEIGRIRSFRHEGFSNGDDLPELIEKAKGHMGLADSVNSGFSDDVLKVEVSGPDKPELTLVDLPGLYHSTSQEQGSEVIGIVRSLTEKYMKNSRSIILAVISAKTDYHLQTVLNMAETFDKNRERTLGVITQPDILEAGSEEEESYLQFLRNERIKLQFGWHALRNRSFETRSVSDQDRDEQERAFFASGKWQTISRECVGIESLRRRLSGLLMKHIQRNLPGLISDIEEQVADREQRLQKLGPSRSTLQQQRGFLLGIGSNFERIAGQALNGMYADDFFKLEGEHKHLRAHIRQLNEYFAEAMSVRGSRRTVYTNLPPDSSVSTGNPYMDGWVPKRITRNLLIKEVSERARQSRGIELPGSANHFLVGSLFRDQSQPWEGLAKAHLLRAWDGVRAFVFLVLRSLTDSHTCNLLACLIVEPYLDKLQQDLLKKLGELTTHLKRGHPLPLSKSFLNRIRITRSVRLVAQIELQLAANGEDPSADFSIYEIYKTLKASEASKDEFAAGDIIDQMEAYYDIAILTFIDNVATLGIENCLLDPVQRIFTSQTVNNMEETQICQLAAEPSYVSEERARLTKELEKLRAGVQTFKVFRPVTLPVNGSPGIHSRFGNVGNKRPPHNPSNGPDSPPQPVKGRPPGGNPSGDSGAAASPRDSTPKKPSSGPSANSSQSFNTFWSEPNNKSGSAGLFGASSNMTPKQPSSGLFSKSPQKTGLFGHSPSETSNNESGRFGKPASTAPNEPATGLFGSSSQTAPPSLFASRPDPFPFSGGLFSITPSQNSSKEFVGSSSSEFGSLSGSSSAQTVKNPLPSSP